MGVPPDPTAISAELSQSLTGGPPPVDLVDRLGGWPAIEALAPTLVDEPLLSVAVSLLVRGVGHAARDTDADLEPILPAALAIADAVLATTDPLQFAHGMDALCSDIALAGMVGRHVAAECFTLAAPPGTDSENPTKVAVLRHAVALETVARLAVMGQASKNKLLGVLEDIAGPQPTRYAQAVVRTVSLAYDHWSLDDETADVIDILSGEKAPKYSIAPKSGDLARNEEYRLDIASDAMWAKANVEVARALRGTSPKQVVDRLDAALEALEYVTTADDRDDAKVLSSALRLLRRLLASLDGVQAAHDATTWDVTIAEAESVVRRAHEFEIGAYGLTHWSGDRKVAVLEGWGRLAHDLAWLRDQLDRDSLYDAAVVLDDILAIYSASRTYDITRTEDGVERVIEAIRPAVAGGFAARAGLMRNLADHTGYLRLRVKAVKGPGKAAELKQRLGVAETVLAAARTSMTGPTEPPGKHHEQVAELPPLLMELFASRGTIAKALANNADQAELDALAADIADKQAAAEPDPDIVVTAVRREMLGKLSSSKDCVGDVVVAVTKVLDQLIKFVARRLNTQSSTKEYLFNPNAKEQDLHVDLYDWLSQGQLASATNVEVQEVGAGRVDIQISFPGFHFYLELKADKSAMPVGSKAAYIQQTVSYQSSDVRIGFLVVLRLTPPKDKSPTMHLTEYVSHATVRVEGKGAERHVIMLEIPGNRTKPSRVH